MPKTGKNRVVFLLGAGASRPFGMPSTEEITGRVISGEGVCRDGRGLYFIGNPPPTELTMFDYWTKHIVPFVRVIHDELDALIAAEKHRRVNYEDIYYIAQQAQAIESGNVDDPVSQPFIHSIRSAASGVLQTMGEDPTILEPSLDRISGETINYIRGIVTNLLSKPPRHKAFRHLLNVACGDEQVSKLDIFTLNHDNVLEHLLRNWEAPFIDGFGIPQNGVRFWDHERYEEETTRVRLFKLHGSIDWIHFRTTMYDVVGIPMDGESRNRTDPHGQGMWPLPPEPLILIGTLNKVFRYTSGIFMDLHCYFHDVLRSNQHLVICGYGFADESINKKIYEFCFESSGNRLVTVGGNIGNLTGDPRYNNCRSRRIIIDKKIEDTTWEEVKESLDL